MNNITIIIPFYNGDYERNIIAKYCSNNTQVNFIIVNDGTCIEFSELGLLENVSVLNVDHRGVSYCRNLGLLFSTTDFVMFWDADDIYPSIDVIQKMYEAAIDNGASVVAGSFADFNGEEIHSEYFGDLKGYTFKTDGWVQYKDYQFDYGFHRFMFNRRFLIDNSLYFVDLIRFQDPPFLTQALHKAGKFYAIHDVAYVYRINNTGFEWTLRRVVDCISGIIINMKFAIDNKYYLLLSYTVCRFVRLLYNEFQNRDFLEKEIRLCVKEIYSLCIDDCLLEIDSLDLKKYHEMLQIIYAKGEVALTIVIPAYNVEKYISNCIDSLLNQTNTRFKIVIIDDGSSDGTSDICKAYAMNNAKNICYYYQNNKGLGGARNTGLSMVDTEYVTFLDSDDWHEPCFVEKLYESLSKTETMPDVIMTLPKCFNEVSKRIDPWMDIDLFEEIYNDGSSDIKIPREDVRMFLLEANANRKIYRTQFLREIEFLFPEGIKWEDIRPHFEILHFANSVVALPNTGFIYRTNTSNQITAETGIGRMDIVPVLYDLLDFCNGHALNVSEKVAVIATICNYSLWMIEMTNTEYCSQLLDGLHGVFSAISKSMIKAFKINNILKVENKKRYLGLIKLMRSNGYLKMVDYYDRLKFYHYWDIHGDGSNNLLTGGIQCIKDSGFCYTMRLVVKKVFFQGF